MSMLELINRMIFDATKNDTVMLQMNMKEFIAHMGLDGRLEAHEMRYGDKDGGFWYVWQFVEEKKDDNVD